MSGDYDNELRGALFKNKLKRPEKQDPDYQGQATVNGVEYWLSSWINTNKKDGSKYMSIVFKAKEEAPQHAAVSSRQEAFQEDSDIPF